MLLHLGVVIMLDVCLRKISNEKFFKKSDFISLLKLRASWGRVGNLSSIGLNYKSALLKKSSWTEQAQYGPEANNIWNTLIYNGSATWAWMLRCLKTVCRYH